MEKPKIRKLEHKNIIKYLINNPLKVIYEDIYDIKIFSKTQISISFKHDYFQSAIRTIEILKEDSFIHTHVYTNSDEIMIIFDYPYIIKYFMKEE